MTAVHAGARDRDRVRARIWSRVLAWAVREDNARTDFGIIGGFNAGVGIVLAAAPSLARSPSLTVLMTLFPRWAWAGAFLATAGLILASLRTRRPRPAGRLRHYGWLAAGTLLVMWITGVLWATGSLTQVLMLLALLAWYTLTAARLELPRLLRG